jgi:hypothetical protein
MGRSVNRDLDLFFERGDDGYRVRVLGSPVGQGQTGVFRSPISELELENFVLRVGRFRAQTRRVEAPPIAAAKQLGGALFEALFTDELRECLRRSIDRASDQHAGVRIRLRMSECPELVELPWELLYDREDDWFLGLSDQTPLVRYVDLPNPPRAIEVTLPLEVLAIRSEPTDYPALHLEGEWAHVRAALDSLVDSGAVRVTELPSATLSELRRALMRQQFHVLHFMGHGAFDERSGGVLIFTDQTGRAAPVTGGDLGVMLRDHTSLRLAVLNACEGARTDPHDPFAGVAGTLVRRGIPAVIAMQFEVTDHAAVEFAPALYGALAAGYPIDGALAEARKAVYAVSPLEWATPVLHMRTDDAQLFDLPAPADVLPVPRPEPQLERPTPVQQPLGPPRTISAASVGSATDADTADAGAAEPAAAVAPAASVAAAAPAPPVASPAPTPRGAADSWATGQVTIAAGALMLAGLFPAFQYDEPLPEARGWLAVYVLAIGLLAIGAGACLIASRTRRIFGPGLVLGTGAALTWGLLAVLLELAPNDDLKDGFQLVVIAHVILLAAGCRVGWVLARSGAVRIRRRLDPGQLPLLVILLGILGALALFYQRRNFVRAEVEWLPLTSAWAIVLAAVMPACAVAAQPRRFGVGLLLGWIAGGVALFGYYFAFLTEKIVESDWDIGRIPIVIFGLSLLALLVVAVPFARAAPPADHEPTSR